MFHALLRNHDKSIFTQIFYVTANNGSIYNDRYKVTFFCKDKNNCHHRSKT